MKMRGVVRGWMSCAALVVALMVGAPARGDELEIRPGQQELALSVGYGFFLPFDVFDDRTDAPFVMVTPSWGKFLGPRNELLVGAPLLFFHRDDSMAAGLSIGIRHHFQHRGRWLPFFEVSAGGVVTDLNVPELGGDFQFIPHGGFGLRYRADDATSLILSARWFHMSNAGLRSPNTGKDNGLVTLSYTRMY
jgi:hypothetical protein